MLHDPEKPFKFQTHKSAKTYPNNANDACLDSAMISFCIHYAHVLHSRITMLWLTGFHLEVSKLQDSVFADTLSTVIDKNCHTHVLRKESKNHFV